MRSLALFVVASLTLLASPLRAADPNKEYIVVSGGVSLHEWEKFKAQPHDGWWLNFVRASRIRIQQIRQEQGPDAKITWLVYSEAYKARQKQEKDNLFGIIGSVRDAYNLKLIYFSKTQELIDYLNHGQDRNVVKIANFEYFGHSNKACFMFDYSNNIDSASKVWLHEDELKNINRGLFAKDAFVKSWGCHTGESFSRKWYSATGTRMWGAIGKTEYQTEELPILSSADGHWSR